VNHLVSWCGYSNKNNNKSREIKSFKSILQSFIDDKWIELIECENLDDIKSNDQFCIIVNSDSIPVLSTDATKGGFIKFTFEEMDKLRLADTKFDIGNLVCAYLATKQFIAEDSIDDTDTQIPNQYRCKIAHPKIDYLMEITDIKSSDTMSKYMDELVRLGMFYSKKAGTIIKKKNGGLIKFDTPTCYTLGEQFLSDAEMVLRKFYGVDVITPYNQEKDKPPVNHNPVRPKKDVNDLSNDMVSDNTTEEKSVHTDTKNIDEQSFRKINQNPFSKDYHPSNNIEDDTDDKLPFDDSGMNPVIEPYKPFGGFYENIKEKPVEQQSDNEWLSMLNKDIFEEEIASEENIDINSIGSDYSDEDEEDDLEKTNIPESIRMTLRMMKKSQIKNENHDLTDNIIADMCSDRKKKDITPADYMVKLNKRLDTQRELDRAQGW
jgi:hypothetical protein